MSNLLPEERKTVTKKDIVRRISTNDTDLTQIKAKEVVQKTLDAIIQALSEEPHRIELRNFGVFEVRRRKPRVARNPKTNDKVQVPAKNVVTFKPGKEMEALIQKITAADLDD
jgi:integration host factor subunit beta